MLDVSKLRIDDKVKCIDEDGFIAVLGSNKNLLDSKNPFIVKSINDNYISFGGAVNGVRNIIFESEYKFFERVTDQTEDVRTRFDFIVDITHKAYKDGLLSSYKVESDKNSWHTITAVTTLESSTLCAFICDDDPTDGNAEIYIRGIQSLYLESFNLNNFADVDKIDLDRNPQIKLSNGFKANIVHYKSGDNPLITVVVDSDEYPRSNFDFTFNMIKGAIITQEMGN